MTLIVLKHDSILLPASTVGQAEVYLSLMQLALTIHAFMGGGWPGDEANSTPE